MKRFLRILGRISVVIEERRRRYPRVKDVWLRPGRRAVCVGWQLATVVLAACILPGVASSVDAEAFVPPNDGQVLERLRTPGLGSESREIKELRRQLNTDPKNLALAEDYVRKCIVRARNESDPRYLGRAQAALGPWWSMSEIPAEALVLRATLKQSQHQFTDALSDLQTALERDPRNGQAWLTRATVFTVLGDYSAARRACLPLAQLSPGLLALTAAASVATLNGEAERGCTLLRDALRTHPEAPSAEKLWALTVLAETAVRMGHEQDAEESFRAGLSIEPRDAYLQSTYAEFLLAQGRANEAQRLLKDTSLSAVLLRLIQAEAQLKPRPASLNEHITTLRTRFEDGHRRGDFVHQREEAQFLLYVLSKPAEALKLAQLNWRTQHEPADARILLESALALNDTAAAQPAIEFIRANRMEDLRIGLLIERLKKVGYREN